MNKLQEYRINYHLGEIEDKVSSVFYLDGIKEYRDIPVWNWDLMMKRYVKARWWIFAHQN